MSTHHYIHFVLIGLIAYPTEQDYEISIHDSKQIASDYIMIKPQMQTMHKYANCAFLDEVLDPSQLAFEY